MQKLFENPYKVFVVAVAFFHVHWNTCMAHLYVHATRGRMHDTIIQTQTHWSCEYLNMNKLTRNVYAKC